MTKEKEQTLTDPCETKKIYAAIDEENNTVEVTHEGNRKTILGNAFDNTIWRIEEFVNDIQSSDDPGFRVSTGRMGRVAFEPTPLGRYFNMMRAFIADFSPAYEYSTSVTLFYRGLTELGLWHEGFQSPYRIVSPEKREGHLFMELVEWIRNQGRAPEFQRKVEFQQLDEKRSFRNLVKYVEALFARYSRLLVIRIDLGYLMAHRGIGVETAQADLRHLLNNRRNNGIFKEKLVGYIWKLEYAELRGHHFHVVLFFDGAKSYKDAHIAERVGQYWVEITNGRGNFYNCNRRKHEYVRCGIGMVSHDDRVMRENLLMAIAYLTKSEQLVRLRRDKHVRAIGRGEMPKVGHSGLGRPRRGLPDAEGVIHEPA
jgi:hypothetical protein